jgi:DNA polymerase-3 subunit beta
VALVTSESKNSIKMHFADNSLELSAASVEYGEAREKIAIQYDGDSVEIAFNPVFLCDPLKVLVQDEVFFEFKDEMSPGVFRTLDSFLCVVMPLRIG